MTEREIELSEDEKAALDQKQRLLLAALERGERPSVTVTWFEPDERKEGGQYVTVAGTVKRIDEAAGCLRLTDGRTIPFHSLLEMELTPD